MIILIYCLRLHFSMITWLTFIQNFGNYSFVCIYWTVYCLRIHYHSSESYWVVLSKYQKNMAPLPFIFCRRKHIFLMIIQTFTEKYFSANLWTADSLNIVDLPFFSFMRYLHTGNPLVANKYNKNIKWGWIRLNDEVDENLLKSAK